MIPDISDYVRDFEAIFDTSDLEVALQFVCLLFRKKPDVNVPDIKSYLLEARDHWRSGVQRWVRVYEYATGSSHMHKVPTVEDFDNVDIDKAQSFFSSCYSDPALFTLVIVGDFDATDTIKLVQKYVGSIPRVPCNEFPINRSDIASIPMNFPKGVLRYDVYAEQSFKEVYICVPLKMIKEKQDEDKFLVQVVLKIVVQKLMTLLREQMGETYKVIGSVSYDGKMEASAASDEAILVISFSYDAHGPIDWTLTESALKAIQDLQCDLTEADITCLSSYTKPTVLDEIVDSYQSNEYKGNLEETIMILG